jgi:hypothetical protein
MKYGILFFSIFFLISCWKPYGHNIGNVYSQQKVWGSKPVYANIDSAKKILYDPVKHPIVSAGNIYAFKNYIFQVDVGRGLHIIDNSIPSKADRIGFITVNGCEQVCIRGSYLYTNSYSDLVIIDISNPANMKIVNRLSNTFPDMSINYPLVEPPEIGYYECPRYDSVVVGWVKDSIYVSCNKLN